MNCVKITIGFMALFGWIAVVGFWGYLLFLGA